VRRRDGFGFTRYADGERLNTSAYKRRLGLPIKRIIVGPGANQDEDFEFAWSVVSNKVRIVTL
jgi:hypothetical protein